MPRLIVDGMNQLTDLFIKDKILDIRGIWSPEHIDEVESRVDEFLNLCREERYSFEPWFVFDLAQRGKKREQENIVRRKREIRGARTMACGMMSTVLGILLHRGVPVVRRADRDADFLIAWIALSDEDSKILSGDADFLGYFCGGEDDGEKRFISHGRLLQVFRDKNLRLSFRERPMKEDKNKEGSVKVTPVPACEVRRLLDDPTFSPDPPVHTRRGEEEEQTTHLLAVKDPFTILCGNLHLIASPLHDELEARGADKPRAAGGQDLNLSKTICVWNPESFKVDVEPLEDAKRKYLAGRELRQVGVEDLITVEAALRWIRNADSEADRLLFRDALKVRDAARVASAVRVAAKAQQRLRVSPSPPPPPPSVTSRPADPHLACFWDGWSLRRSAIMGEPTGTRSPAEFLVVLDYRDVLHLWRGKPKKENGKEGYSPGIHQPLVDAVGSIFDALFDCGFKRITVVAGGADGPAFVRGGVGRDKRFEDLPGGERAGSIASVACEEAACRHQHREYITVESPSAADPTDAIACIVATRPYAFFWNETKSVFFASVDGKRPFHGRGIAIHLHRKRDINIKYGLSPNDDERQEIVDIASEEMALSRQSESVGFRRDPRNNAVKAERTGKVTTVDFKKKFFFIHISKDDGSLHARMSAWMGSGDPRRGDNVVFEVEASGEKRPTAAWVAPVDLYSRRRRG